MVSAAYAIALLRRPAVERLAARHSEIGQEGPGVQFGGVEVASLAHRGEEVVEIDPHRAAERNIARAAGDAVVAEELAQLRERLAQRLPRAVGIGVRPEEVDEALAARRALGGEGDVHEQRVRFAAAERGVAVARVLERVESRASERAENEPRVGAARGGHGRNGSSGRAVRQ